MIFLYTYINMCQKITEINKKTINNIQHCSFRSNLNRSCVKGNYTKPPNS